MKTQSPQEIVKLITTHFIDHPHEITGFKIVGEHKTGNTILEFGSPRKLSRKEAAKLKIKS